MIRTPGSCFMSYRSGSVGLTTFSNQSGRTVSRSLDIDVPSKSNVASLNSTSLVAQRCRLPWFPVLTRSLPETFVITGYSR